MGASAYCGPFGAPKMALSDSVIRKAKPTGKVQRLFDAGGLYLEVTARGAVKSGGKVAGLLTGLLSSQPNKTLNAVHADNEGEQMTPWEYVAGPND